MSALLAFLEYTEITPRHWVGFVLCILLLLALDLGVFHKKAHVVRFREALIWTTVWFLLAMSFGASLILKRNREEALEFITGYILELSLSMDNVFVMAVIFGYFRVPAVLQHRVLFWGILGALVMRGAMISMGVVLIAWTHWVLYGFGLLLIVSGIKMVSAKEEGMQPEKNPLIRLARKAFRVTNDFNGQHFVIRVHGHAAITPLMLVLLMIETTDLVFALDSIPAIFAVTNKPFIIFTSNVFAILGLRSLYFVLAGAIGYFRYLKVGLSVVLIFIGAKMLAVDWLPIPVGWSLTIIASILIVSILYSMLANRHERRHEPTLVSKIL